MSRPWAGSSALASRLAAIRATLPAGAVELACHAAAPAVVDPEFLHLLRINFFLEPSSSALPYETEAALLMSPLFQELGSGLYEIDPVVRRPLLDSLVAAFGRGRLAQIGILLEQYADTARLWEDRVELDHAQRLTALSLVDPVRANEWLAGAADAAGSALPLAREWFVAMHDTLQSGIGDDTGLSRRTEEATEALGSDDAPTREAAIRTLGELALLPGSDVRTIVRRLRHLQVDDTGLTVLARQVTATLTTVMDLTLDVADDPETPPPISLLSLLGIDNPHAFDPAKAWSPRDRHRLRVPIGITTAGQPVELDIKEATQDGMGPHGLLIGAPGSGRSELLRTLVLALALTHPPEDINFVLVDPGRGTTFERLEPLPHVADLITISTGEVTKTVHLAECLQAEMLRRQETLAKSGNFASLHDYNKARAQVTTMEPLPTLLIVLDRFSELLNLYSEFIEVVVQVCRTGRSLGMHLLVADDRMTQGWFQEVGTHLNYRLALRTFSGMESRVVIGVGDAFDLPDGGGHCYLVPNPTAQPVRFRAAYHSDEIAQRAIRLGGAVK